MESESVDFRPPKWNTRHFEFLWFVCWSVVNGNLTVHPEFAVLAKEMEPELFTMLRQLDPNYVHPREVN